jgi:hypothetical protein
MSDDLTLDELARRLEEPADHLSEWRSLGLIGRAQSDTFGPDDIERARLVRALRRRGIELAAIVRADLLKEEFQRFCEYVRSGWAERHLRHWLGWAMRSRLQPMKRFARNDQDPPAGHPRLDARTGQQRCA